MKSDLNVPNPLIAKVNANIVAGHQPETLLTARIDADKAIAWLNPRGWNVVWDITNKKWGQVRIYPLVDFPLTLDFTIAVSDTMVIHRDWLGPGGFVPGRADWRNGGTIDPAIADVNTSYRVIDCKTGKSIPTVFFIEPETGWLGRYVGTFGIGQGVERVWEIRPVRLEKVSS
jgi:hypothetical protein